MGQLTVAEAAAIINVAIVFVQLTFPLLTTLVAVGIAKKASNAATFSVFGRLINESLWRIILGTDTASGRGVDKRIRGISIFSTIATYLLALTAIVTPLGLHTTLKQTESGDVSFTYVKDTSAMGQSVQPHGDYAASRVCSGFLITFSCPGNDDGYILVTNSTGEYAIPQRDDASISTTIGRNVTDVFGPSAEGNKDTVAGIFDIQWRSFVNYNNQTRPGDNESVTWLDQGKLRTQGRFRYYQQFLLENRTLPVEGLIVSTDDRPGLGFRNHTLPPSSEYGYTWTEDILWLEPETTCTALNLTYEFTMPPGDNTNRALNRKLVDRGGFVNLPPEIPVLDLNNTQANPQLQARSWYAAILTNQILAGYMNLTRRELRLNKEYLLDDYLDDLYTSGSGSNAEPNKLIFSAFGSADGTTKNWKPNLPGPLTYLSSTYSGNDNLSDNFFNVDTAVEGYGIGDPLNISTIGAGGGLMLGIGTLLDADGNPITDSNAYSLAPGTNWSQPIFSCISAVKASVKSVRFQINGTALISNLVIQDVQDQEYDSEDSMPIWAMENPGLDIAYLSPLWGIVSEDKRTRSGISTLQQPHFYLPAGAASRSASLSYIDDAVAGATAPWAAFSTIFNSYSSYDNGGAQDYSGGSNWLLFIKWQQLLSKQETAGKVIDYIWTDLLANALVGAKSVLSTTSDGSATDGPLQRRAEPAQSTTRPAEQYSLRLSYDWKYAIPALVFALVYAGLFVWSMFMFLSKGLSIKILRFMLNQTAAGRAMTTERHQASSDADIGPTPVWARIRGSEMLRVSKDNAGSPHIDPQGYYPLDVKDESHISTSSAHQEDAGGPLTSNRIS